VGEEGELLASGERKSLMREVYKEKKKKVSFLIWRWEGGLQNGLRCKKKNLCLLASKGGFEKQRWMLNRVLAKNSKEKKAVGDIYSKRHQKTKGGTKRKKRYSCLRDRGGKGIWGPNLLGEALEGGKKGGNR